jgi:hypothetical protein
MKYLHISHIAAIALISGCTGVPVKYNLTSTRLDTPTRITSSIKGVETGAFSYNSPGDLGQFKASSLGCLPCRNNGTTPGITFAQPINEIVKQEFNSSLAEALLPSNSTPCIVNGIIHMAAHDVMNGDQTLDITYVISANEIAKYKKRIKVTNSSPLFGGLPLDRIFQKATQKSVEELLADTDFRTTISKSCQA